MELVDRPASKPGALRGVGVRVPLPARKERSRITASPARALWPRPRPGARAGLSCARSFLSARGVTGNRPRLRPGRPREGVGGSTPPVSTTPLARLVARHTGPIFLSPPGGDVRWCALRSVKPAPMAKRFDSSAPHPSRASERFTPGSTSGSPATGAPARPRGRFCSGVRAGASARRVPATSGRPGTEGSNPSCRTRGGPRGACPVRNRNRAAVAEW